MDGVRLRLRHLDPAIQPVRVPQYDSNCNTGLRKMRAEPKCARADPSKDTVACRETSRALVKRNALESRDEPSIGLGPQLTWSLEIKICTYTSRYVIYCTLESLEISSQENNKEKKTWKFSISWSKPVTKFIVSLLLTILRLCGRD